VTGNGDVGDLAAQRARLVVLRQHLGAHLAAFRWAAAVTQSDLARALDRTRSTVSKVEHGTRAMPEGLWKIADDLCGADGALIAEHTRLVQAERDYRARCRTQRRTARQAAGQAELDALRASPASSSAVLASGGDAWPQTTLVSGEVVGEFMAMVTRLVQAVGRRHAMQLASWMLATIGLTDLDTDDYSRLTHAVANPSRIDTQVIDNLAISLAACKRLEDALGPGEVLDTAITQHAIVRRLLTGCAEQLRKPLRLLDANMSVTIGGYLIDLGHPNLARRYFERARKAAHDAANPTYAAYAACWVSSAAFLRHDTPTALDAAAAARSLAARTSDPQLKSSAEQMAAAAYALDGQHGPCMTACQRAHEFLTANGSIPDSPAYWIHHGTIDSQLSTYLCLLNKPAQAVQAAHTAHIRFNRNYPIGYAHCQIRLAHALTLDKDATQAAHVLAEAASSARLLSPRLTEKLHTTRALLQPWQHTAAVKTLDDQLKECKLLPARQP
jgi:DNA-binding XRE family transcriptional regulator